MTFEILHVILLEVISTHTPLAGRDHTTAPGITYPEKFLLTRPLRDVTKPLKNPYGINPISTHTPLAGRDWMIPAEQFEIEHFYSHAPCGTWHICPDNSNTSGIFLLTRPLRDVTSSSVISHSFTVDFYSHAPCGTWRCPAMQGCPAMHFYSHAPCGTWQTLTSTREVYMHFYSHAPCGTWLFQWFSLKHLEKFLLTRPLRDVTQPYASWCTR